MQFEQLCQWRLMHDSHGTVNRVHNVDQQEDHDICYIADIQEQPLQKYE